MKQQWIKALFILFIGMSFFKINVHAQDTPPASENSAGMPSEKMEDKKEMHEAKKENRHDKKKTRHERKEKRHNRKHHKK